MKIDKEKPLPDHTKLDYDECCAFLILKELFPERYPMLQISDKPDLQGIDRGIEVTIANDGKYQEALNNWVKAYTCADEEKQKNYIERMKQLGVTYTGGVQVWPVEENPSMDNIKNAVNKKMKKVSLGKYKKFREYELFIFTNTFLHEKLLREVIEFFENLDVFDYFVRVYILETGFKLHIFQRNSHEIVDIDIFEQTKRNVRARKMVEEAEVVE